MDRLKKLKKRWRARRPKLVSRLMHGIVAAIGRTLRVETRGFEPSPERTIYCGWHGRSFPFAVHFRDRGWWVIISRSRDGDIQNAIFERLGYRIVRGSTGRGGVRAALCAIRALREGAVLAMTPDGPRGPAEEVQEGIVLIAQRSGSRIVPVGVAAKPAWTASKSWDRYLVPKPFARAILIAGEPITVSPEAGPEAMETIRVTLQSSIARVQAEANATMGPVPSLEPADR